MSVPSTSSTIKINLSDGILENAKTEAARIGISVQDFIRMLMATYFANSQGLRAVSRDKTLLEQAQEEIAEGKFKSVKSEEELETYLLEL